MNPGAYSSSKASSSRYSAVIVDTRSSYYTSTSSTTSSMSSSRGSTSSSSPRTSSTTDSSRGSSPAMQGEYRDRNANGHKASYNHGQKVTVLQPYGARGYDRNAPTASYHVPKDSRRRSSG